MGSASLRRPGRRRARLRLNGDELIDVDLAALLARAPRARRRGDARRRAAADGVRRRRHRGRRPSPVSTRRRSSRTGSTPASTSSTTRRSRGSRRRATTSRRRSRCSRRRASSTPTATRALADGQHTEGPASRGGLRRAQSRTGSAAGWSRHERSLYSPNLDGLDRFAFEPTEVDKPWGYELIWALTDEYCGKVLFVRAGESLSLQFHREKDESWLIQSGRAEIEIGAVGEADARPEVVGAGAAFRFRPERSTASRRSRTRRSSRSRRRRSTTSSGSKTLRPREHRVATLPHLW